jgi:TonB-dependent SusC/RagA subfamily outer membrane receptor
MGRIPMKKRFTILISLFVLSTMLSSAQKVSLNFSGQNLRTVLESITEQTDYSLAYSKEAVDLSDDVTIRVTDAELSQVLSQLLSPRQIGFELRDNKIYLFVKPAEANTASGQDQQQDVTLRGTVTDDMGEPIIGVNIVVPGSTIGTVTDVNGNYSMILPRGSALRFFYIGYVDQEFTITNQSTLNVQLLEDTELLDELIVVGYGVQRKSVVTAAISQVSAEELNVTRPTRVEDALKGKVSGVQITQSSGQPGSDSKVRIRGIGTINNSEPLYIVDGMEVGGGISYLNPVDIASVEILKDAASAAIYGSRAANGVILVTTKKGATGKATINYDVSYGWQNPWKKREILNATEYMVIMNESRLNDGNLPLFNTEQMASLGNGTDWQDETFY